MSSETVPPGATGPEFSLFATPPNDGLNLAPLDPVATVPPALYGSSNGAVSSDHASNPVRAGGRRTRVGGSQKWRDLVGVSG